MEVNLLEGCIGEAKGVGGSGRENFLERRDRERQLHHSLGDIV